MFEINYTCTPLHFLLNHLTPDTSNHFTSPSITLNHVTSNHIATNDFTSHLSNSFHITSHLITSFYSMLTKLHIEYCWNKLMVQSFNYHTIFQIKTIYKKLNLKCLISGYELCHLAGCSFL